MEKCTEQLVGVGLLLFLLFLGFSQPADITYSLDSGETVDVVNDGDFDTRIDYFMLKPLVVEGSYTYDDVIPAATYLMPNGDFEIGNYSGWTALITYDKSGDGSGSVHAGTPHTGNYGICLEAEGEWYDYTSGDRGSQSWVRTTLSQTIDCTDVDRVNFYAYRSVVGSSTGSPHHSMVTVGNVSKSVIAASWLAYSMDVSSLSGSQTITLEAYADADWDYETSPTEKLYVDDLTYHTVEKNITVTVFNSDALEPNNAGITVNGQHLYYEGPFHNYGINWKEGVANINGVVTTKFKGEMPLIPAGTTGHVRLDTGLDGVFLFQPVRLKYEFDTLDDEGVHLSVYLTDGDFNRLSSQPSRYRLKMYNTDGDEVFETTSCTEEVVVPIEVYAKNYTVGISFDDWLFDGWSNEVTLPAERSDISNFSPDVPERTGPVPRPDDPPYDPEDIIVDPIDLIDDIIEDLIDDPIGTVEDIGETIGYMGGDFYHDVVDVVDNPDDGILQMSTRGWLRLPVSNDLIISSTSVVGFDVVEWSGFDGGMFFE